MRSNEELVKQAESMTEEDMDTMIDRGETLIAKGTAMTNAEVEELTEIYVISRLLGG